jgi:hypothetical protein
MDELDEIEQELGLTERSRMRWVRGRPGSKWQWTRPGSAMGSGGAETQSQHKAVLL